MKDSKKTTSTEPQITGSEKAVDRIENPPKDESSLKNNSKDENIEQQESAVEDKPTGKIKEIILELDQQEKQQKQNQPRRDKPKGKKASAGKGLFASFIGKKKDSSAKAHEESRDKRLYEEYMKKIESGEIAPRVERETPDNQEYNTFYYKTEESENKSVAENNGVVERRKKKTADPQNLRKREGRKLKPSDTRSIRMKPGLNIFHIIELVVLVVLLASVGFVGKYIWDYTHTNSLTIDDSKKKAGSNDAFPRDINPFELFSSRKPDLIATFGDPISEGEDDVTQERYMNYEYEWFKSPAIARVFHGKEQRVYRIDVQFKNDNMDAMKGKMEKVLGEPWQSNLEKSEDKEVKDRFVKWIKDSVSYKLIEGKDQKAYLEMKLALYPNTNHLEVGSNPTMIERHDGKDYTGDGKPDSIILLGDKANFTDYYYTNLYILIWDGTKNMVGNFPENMDGGVMPQMEVISVEGQAPKLLITTTNNAAKNYNIFQVQKEALVNLYSSHDAPKEAKK